jgi:hypothetical protein
MAQAIFGLIGVLVGGLLTGASQWWQTHQARQLKKRAAARLVLEELADTYAVVRAALGNSDETTAASALREDLDSGLLTDSAWKEHRPLLAEELPDDDWRVLADAYFEIRELRTAEADALLVQKAEELDFEPPRMAVWPHAFPSRTPRKLDLDGKSESPQPT